MAGTTKTGTRVDPESAIVPVSSDNQESEAELSTPEAGELVCGDVAIEIMWELPGAAATLLTDDHKVALSRRYQGIAQGLSGHPQHGDAAGRPVSVLWCDDAQIRSLNGQWRQLDKATDVLSFAFDEADAPPIAMDADDWALPLGDIIISVPTAAAQARSHGWTPLDELTFLFVHGLCHLMGHDHAEPHQAESMASVERDLLNYVGLVRPDNVGF